jgi:hypothetical protein
MIPLFSRSDQRWTDHGVDPMVMEVFKYPQIHGSHHFTTPTFRGFDGCKFIASRSPEVPKFPSQNSLAPFELSKGFQGLSHICFPSKP